MSTLVLFREADTLKLWTGRRLQNFNSLRIVHHREDDKAWLTITNDGISEDFAYLIEDEIDDDPFTMSDPEDFDFGLFLTNIHSDPERHNLLFQMMPR